jgi:succinyl-diaminopimelate desuccinylase
MTVGDDNLPLQQLVAFARDLIAIPTVNPPGDAYDECVERIAHELERLGLAYRLIDTGTPQAPRRTIVSAPAAPGPPLYLHGHYDVVPAFSPEQFEPRVTGGRLVGRGASDMKGGLAAMVYAARACADRNLSAALVIVPDEETGGLLGAERLAELGLLRTDAPGAIVCEPTWGTVWHACRGAFTIRVTVRGRAAHVGLHYLGRNAFADAITVVRALEPLRDEVTARRSALDFGSGDPGAHESIMLVGGRAEGGVNFNVVPGRFSFTIDRRPNPDESYEAARDELLGALQQARRDTEIELDWEVLQDAPGTLLTADDPFVGAVVGAVERRTGARPTVTCCPGVLETRVYRRLGLPAVAFGPGLVEQMHAPDEDVPIANLAAAASIYADVASALAAPRS